MDAEPLRHLLRAQLLDSYRTPLGVVGLRLVLDARSVPALAAQLDVMLSGAGALALRAVHERAHRRDGLTVPVDVALEVLTGATLSRVLLDTRSRSPRGQQDGLALPDRARARTAQRPVVSSPAVRAWGLSGHGTGAAPASWSTT